jgi:hypothetical protein
MIVEREPMLKQITTIAKSAELPISIFTYTEIMIVREEDIKFDVPNVIIRLKAQRQWRNILQTNAKLS